LSVRGYSTANLGNCAGDVDDIDALLEDLDGPSAPPAASSAAASAPIERLTTVEAVQEALAVPGISKTRKTKLKQHLKTLEVCSF
jgi:hypothetical protein